MENKRSLSEKWREAKEGHGGYITRGSGAGDGIVEVIPVYDPKEEEDRGALEEVADNLDEFINIFGIRERMGKSGGTGVKSGVKSTNSTLTSIITKVVERPEVSSKLQEIKNWYQDPDYMRAIAHLIIKNYPQFNFEESKIIRAIKEMYE